MHISTQKKSFTYLGGKFSILPWLLPKLEVPCNHFVDVFGGSAVVVLNRDRTPIETYNDKNGKLVNFFKVLRDHTEQLIEQLQLTPHSWMEYQLAWDSEDDNDIERARKFFARTQQSIYAAGAQDKVKGWTASISESRTGFSQRTAQWLRSINNLWEVAERLRHVQIECRDFRFILKNYNDSDTLFYCDSPYSNELRSKSRYEFDFEHQDHQDLRYWSDQVKGKIAISGYDTEFMRELFKCYTLHVGPQRKNTASKKQAVECLWTNY